MTLSQLIMKKIFVLLFTGLLLSGCGGRTQQAATTSQYIKMRGFAQGTTYSFVLNAADTTGLQYAIDSLFKAVNMSMSVYEPKSLINRLNANETDSADRYITYCIDVARRFSEMSGGAYDITIKPVTQALGYAGGDAEKRPNIDSLLQYVGYDKIRVENGRLIKAHPAMQLDLNSVAKGYTSDLLGELMESRGIRDYLVEVGGEIYCRGKNRHGKDWTVGIDQPFEGNMLPGIHRQVTLSVSDMGLATSGNYRKFHIDDEGRKVAHIVNARTGRSEFSNLLSATVIAENTATADAAGTMFMIVGLERSIEILEQHPEWMGFLIYDDGKGGFATYATENLKARIVK